MAGRRHKSHGKWVWQARVAFRGRRTSVYRATYAEARTAERQLLERFEAEAEREAQAAAAAATLRMLFEGYVADLAHRRKSADTIGRAVTTAKAVETLMPELLDLPVSRIGDRELYAFTRARSAKATPGTINRDLRTLRAMLKRARPEYRFPGAVFFPTNDTRVRWLRPEEEILVLETMPSPFREIAKLAELTLMRQGESSGRSSARWCTLSRAWCSFPRLLREQGRDLVDRAHPVPLGHAPGRVRWAPRARHTGA